MKNLYYKEVNKEDAKEMFEFLKHHFAYATMNSWNGLYSIANNVKIYNLELDGDEWLALGIIQNDDYDIINSMLKNWEEEHPGYILGFNGGSGGYIVMYNENNNGNILPNWINDSEDYDDFKEIIKDYYDSVEGCIEDLKWYVELVQSFDMLCDEIRDYVNELSKIDKDEMTNEELERFVENFNWQYGEDLHALNIDELKVEKDDKGYYVNINQLTKSNSLMDNFENQLRDYDNAISLYKVNWNDGYDIFRLEYNG